MREITNLASQRTETKRIQEIPSADFTQMGVAFSTTNHVIGFWLILRPLIQEKNSSTVDHISLNSTDIQNLLNLCYPHNIMIRRPPYLHYTYISKYSILLILSIPSLYSIVILIINQT